MAKKIQKKSNDIQKTSFRKLKLGPILLAFLILSIFTYVSYGFYQKEILQKQYSRLESAGRVLDKTHETITGSGIDAEVFRTNYCWRTGEKHGEGTRICDQRLVVVGKNKAIKEQGEDINILLTATETIFSNEFDRHRFTSYSTTGHINADASLGYELSEISKCTLEYNALDGSRKDSRYRNVYALDIICSEDKAQDDFYPLEARYGWTTFIRATQ